jgi:hypothetical protein
LFLTEAMRNPPGGNSTFVQAFSQNAVGRCEIPAECAVSSHVILRSSYRIWSTVSTLWSSVDVRGRPDFGSFSMLNLPSRKH